MDVSVWPGDACAAAILTTVRPPGPNVVHDHVVAIHFEPRVQELEVELWPSHHALSRPFRLDMI